MPLTLEGLKVIDLTQNVAGPFCTQLLGDFGADVIKIERPGRGDDVRGFAPQWRGESAAYLAYNRNKRSVCIDLDHPRGCELVAQLAQSADIFVHSMKPGSTEARGLGYADLAASNPGLIYGSISGFGESGPLRSLPGYDPLGQAYSGIISMNGHPGAPPARVVVPIIDMGSGLWLFTGILAALIERNKTGRGAKVATSLLETGVGWTTLALAGYQASGVVPGPAGSTSPAAAPYEAFRTADGWIQIAAGNDRLFVKLCEVLGCAEVAGESRFATNQQRVAARNQLHQLLERRTEQFSAQQLMGLLREAGVPASVINTLDKVFADEQVNALGMLPAVAPDFRIPEMKLVDLPVSINGARASLRRMPPILGEHTDEVLRQSGYSDADISELRRLGIIQ
ncbi:MAG TPA: CaiB/BaiF CoA-transferase family protein [Candidatus Binataceae bacterium]|jgi:crotonobetainyl-CoA:carnitine CoA-transferase CaiB-like acyl-CoA transferase|nr:CaiB/BaiF CoA-transferase family protein [Candidatus Binataceae bacterium]